jgi:hypothetical protein
MVRGAPRVGRVLPAFSHRFSPQKFTQSQLFACLVLREVLKTDYRGLTDFLRDCPDLGQVSRGAGPAPGSGQERRRD